MGEFSILVPFALMPNALTVSGGSLQNYLRTREELMQRANDVIAGIRAGWLKLNIGRVLPLARAAQAHELLETRKTDRASSYYPSRIHNHCRKSTLTLRLRSIPSRDAGSKCRPAGSCRLE
jgi:hypothetical protein